MEKNKAVIVLENGIFFKGYGLNINEPITGELCFTTSQTGYQETITDPSYKEQILIFSFPHIGIVGINDEDYESKKVYLSAIVISHIEEESFHYLKKNNFLEWIKINNMPVIHSIDTRSLIAHLRDSKTSIKAVIAFLDDKTDIKSLVDKLVDKAKFSKNLCSSYLIPKNKDEIVQYNILTNQLKYKILLLDFGLKLNIIRCLNTKDCNVYVCSPDIDYNELMKIDPHGIVLSNGPGDPQSVLLRHNDLILNIINSGIPILGICLGFQIIAVALGAKTEQMNNAHHGINHPIYDNKNDKVIITSQNHEFHVVKSTINDNIVISHHSLFDDCIEGFTVKNKPIIAVQFHPEGCPGPSDSLYIFDEFINLVREHAKKK